MKTSQTLHIIGLDVGERRIGAAIGDSAIRIASPLTTIIVDGNEFTAISDIIREQSADKIVVGLPRNQSGEETAQSQYARSFAAKLNELGFDVVFQDESVTSVQAEEYLKQSGKPYAKEDIDARAAAIILSDYLESF